MLKDYDMIVLYHPSKANVIADDISRMNMGSVSHIDGSKKDLVKDIHMIACLGLRMVDSPKKILWSIITPNHLLR